MRYLDKNRNTRYTRGQLSWSIADCLGLEAPSVELPIRVGCPKSLVFRINNLRPKVGPLV